MPAKYGIYLALENHGGITGTAEQLLALVKAVKHDWFGVNLDTGNFHTADPYGDLEKAAPYAVTVQVKTEIQRRGMKKEDADLKRLIDILRRFAIAAMSPWNMRPPRTRARPYPATSKRSRNWCAEHPSKPRKQCSRVSGSHVSAHSAALRVMQEYPQKNSKSLYSTQAAPQDFFHKLPRLRGSEGKLQRTVP